MDEKQIATLRKFTSTLADPSVRPFVDVKKLHASGIFNLAVQMGTDHAVKHGDFVYLNAFLSILGDTPECRAFVASLRPRLRFIVTDTQPRTFKKATEEQVALHAKKTLAKAKAIQATPQAGVEKKAKRGVVSEDIMDSRFMLPGSFGSGRRR